MADAIKPKLGVIVASFLSVRCFLKPHLEALSEKYDVVLMANSSDAIPGEIAALPVRFIHVNIERKIAPLKDIIALFALLRLFHKKQFDLVHSVSPKAGLLAMVAACIARTPVRVHTFTGQVWVTRQGPSRWLLKTMDKILARCATHLLADSPSQRQFIINEGIADANKIHVLAHGSISGVSTTKFSPDAAGRAAVRQELEIPEDAVVFLYLGRLNRDKGVLDLAHAFAQMAGEHPHAHLLLVGPDEEGLEAAIRQICSGCARRLHRVGYTDTPQRYMAAADVFCLPSYREGFGTVIIEAAAVGLPAIGSRIYGVVDAIVENETGVLFPPRDVSALVSAMIRLMQEPTLRHRLGQQARARAIREFSSEVVVKAWLDFYARLQ